MARYVIRRVLWVIVLLFAVSFLTFVIFYVLPSADPARIRAGKNPNPELIKSIRHTLGLDRSIFYQYLHYMERLLFHFDFGESYQYRTGVKDLLFARLPNTIYLTAGAVVVWLVIGLAVGIISAARRGSLLDRVSMSLALLFVSVPVYFLGLLSLYLFDDKVGKIHLLPGFDTYNNADGFFAHFGALIMPWFVLAASFAAIYARLLRGSLLETLSEDYIRTARAKGLSERRVVMRHGMRAAITPIITVLGLDVGILLGGAILTESVFSIDGIGGFAYNAIKNSDLPTIQGTVLLGAFFIVVGTLVVDILYAFLDPRVRYS